MQCFDKVAALAGVAAPNSVFEKHPYPRDCSSKSVMRSISEFPSTLQTFRSCAMLLLNIKKSASKLWELLHQAQF